MLSLSSRKISRCLAASLTAFLSLSLTGCGGDGEADRVQGSHHPATETRVLPAAFTKIDLEIPCLIVIHNGEQQGMTVEFDDNLLPMLTTDTTGDTMTITTSKPYMNGSCKIDLTCPHLTALKIQGAAEVKIDKIDEESFDVTVSGAGDVTAAGACRTAYIKINGAGNVNLQDLHSQDAIVSIQGAGNGIVCPTDVLNANIVGAGSIKYKGTPKKIDKHISGVGSISPI